MLISLFPYLLA